MDREKLLRAVLDAGAAKAAYVAQSQIVLSASFRAICETNQCGGYGRCWMCPPFIGEIEPLMDRVRSFSGGLLYQTIATIEDSFDIEGMFEAGRVHAQVSQRIQSAVQPLIDTEFLHLSCGGCHLCDVCAKRSDQPCRHPDQALTSLEGYGVDVYNTTSSTDLKYINGQNTVTYFGMILL
jgi:predicted metal-binding protein